MNHASVVNWIDMYIKAWKSPGTSLLKKLFTDNVSYIVSPWKQPIKGIEAVSSFWEKARSGPNEAFDLTSEIVAIERKTAVIRVEVTYQERKEQWKDLWIVIFSEDGLCDQFEEWPFSKEQNDGQFVITST